MSVSVLLIRHSVNAVIGKVENNAHHRRRGRRDLQSVTHACTSSHSLRTSGTGLRCHDSRRKQTADSRRAPGRSGNVSVCWSIYQHQQPAYRSLYTSATSLHPYLYFAIMPISKLSCLKLIDAVNYCWKLEYRYGTQTDRLTDHQTTLIAENATKHRQSFKTQLKSTVTDNNGDARI